jgi:hypothetical protein
LKTLLGWLSDLGHLTTEIHYEESLNLK